MNDKARELLERVIAETDSSHFYTSEIDKEIRAYLAKPMTKEEIARGFYSGRWLYEDFEAGIRFAEKHHGIGGEE